MSTNDQRPGEADELAPARTLAELLDELLVDALDAALSGRDEPSPGVLDWTPAELAQMHEHASTLAAH